MDGAEEEAMHQVEDMLDSVRWEEEGASEDVSLPIISVKYLFKQHIYWLHTKVPPNPSPLSNPQLLHVSRTFNKNVRPEACTSSEKLYSEVQAM